MTATLCGTPLSDVDTGTAATFSHTLAAGDDRLVVALVGWGTPVDLDITGVTYGGVAMVQQGTQYQSQTGSGARCAAFVLAEADLPADGAQTVDPSWSATSAGTEVSVHVICLQDVASPTYLTSGFTSTGISSAYYPVTITLTGLAANSVILTFSVHTDVDTGALSCDIGTDLTEVNIAGQIRAQAAYLLDSGTAGNKSAVWDVAAEGAGTKAVSMILGVQYTAPAAPSSSASGWGVLI